MNPTNRKIILEHIQVAKTALCRISHFYRGQGLLDEGSRILSELNIKISETENYFFNQPDDPPEEHPLIWALRTALKSNRDIRDEDIAALVRQTLKESWNLNTYEVILEGHNGINNKDTVRWVAAPSSQAVKAFARTDGFGCLVIDIKLLDHNAKARGKDIDITLNEEGIKQ